MSILEIKDIEVDYGVIKALKGISLSIERGEIVSLIGANGAGESTLLKSITALEPLVEGEIKFEDEIIARCKVDKKNMIHSFFSKKDLTTDKIISKGISLVPEGREVFADLTVLENLEMGAYLQRDKDVIKQKLEEMYDVFSILKERKNQKAGSLSGGEQQMLAIARALMNSPRLLLLDEPGLGLAPLVIRDIFDIIEKINKEEDVTIFLVEQNAKIALKISDRGYVMETGKIILNDSSANLLENPDVKATYLGE